MNIIINENTHSFNIAFESNRKKEKLNCKNDWIARILDLDLKYDFKREFLDNSEPIFLTFNAIYEASEKVSDKYAWEQVKDVRHYFQIIDNAIHILNKNEVKKAFKLKNERLEKFNLIKSENIYTRTKINLLNNLQKLLLQNNINYDYTKSFYLLNNEEIKIIYKTIIDITVNSVFLNAFYVKFSELKEKIERETKKEKTLTHA